MQFDGVWLEGEHGPLDFADIGALPHPLARSGRNGYGIPQPASRAPRLCLTPPRFPCREPRAGVRPVGDDLHRARQEVAGHGG
eukprot:COSAG04_NODE_2997_length_3295_cov_1.976846_4_plen_83_part_00